MMKSDMRCLIESFIHDVYKQGKNFVKGIFGNNNLINDEQYEYLKKDAQKKVRKNIRAYNKLKEMILDPSYKPISPKYATLDDLEDVSMHRFLYTHKEYDDIIFNISKQFSNSKNVQVINQIINNMNEKKEYNLKVFQKFCKLLYNFAKKYKISILDSCRIHGIYKKNMNVNLYSKLMNNIEDIVKNNNKDMYSVQNPILLKMIQVNMDRYYKFDIGDKIEDNNEEDHDNWSNKRKEKYEYLYNDHNFGPFEPYYGFRKGTIKDVINSFDKDSKEIVHIDSNGYYEDYDDDSSFNESFDNMRALIYNYLK